MPLRPILWAVGTEESRESSSTAYTCIIIHKYRFSTRHETTPHLSYGTPRHTPGRANGEPFRFTRIDCHVPHNAIIYCCRPHLTARSQMPACGSPSRRCTSTDHTRHRIRKRNYITPQIPASAAPDSKQPGASMIEPCAVRASNAPIWIVTGSSQDRHRITHHSQGQGGSDERLPWRATRTPQARTRWR